MPPGRNTVDLPTHTAASASMGWWGVRRRGQNAACRRGSPAKREASSLFLSELPCPALDGPLQVEGGVRPGGCRLSPGFGRKPREVPTDPEPEGEAEAVSGTAGAADAPGVFIESGAQHDSRRHADRATG